MVYTENTIKESAEAFVPVATGEYERMMNETITELRARAEIKAAPGRVLWRALGAAAAAALHAAVVKGFVLLAERTGAVAVGIHLAALLAFDQAHIRNLRWGRSAPP